MSSDNTSAAAGPVIFFVIAGVLVQNVDKITPLLKNLGEWVAIIIGSVLITGLVLTLIFALLCSLYEGLKNMIKEYFRKREEEKSYFEERLSTALSEASRARTECVDLYHKYQDLAREVEKLKTLVQVKHEVAETKVSITTLPNTEGN